MQLSNRLSEYARACFSSIWIESHEHQDAVPRKKSIRVAFESLTTIEILYTAGYLRQFFGWQRCKYGCLEGGLSVSSSLVCPSSETGSRELGAAATVGRLTTVEQATEAVSS